MDFIDNIDFVSSRNRAVVDRLDNFTRIVNASMAGRVNFQNVNMAAGGEGRTGFAYAAWLKRGFAFAIGADTVQAFGKKPGCRGFADAANAGQDKGMGKPAKRQGVAEGAHQCILSDEC